MKQAKTKIITTLLAVTMAFSLTACGDKPCEHTYDNACDTICNICSEERTTTHTPNADDGDCTTAIVCSDCGTVTTEAKETHTLEKYIDNKDGTHSPACQYCDYVDTTTTEKHNVNSTTGNCSVCDNFVAVASITVDGIKTYYATFNEAINFAKGKDGTVVIENDCYDTDAFGNFESGSVIIDLNGKTIGSTGTYSIPISGATVTIRDSVGGGKTLKIVGGWSGNLIIEGGIHEQVIAINQTTITGGEFAWISVSTGDTATISGGSFEKIEVYSGMGTLADILADGYCFYDKDGNVVDISTIQTDSLGWYYLYNVTVGAIQ